jgi:hypothetical protein
MVTRAPGRHAWQDAGVPIAEISEILISIPKLLYALALVFLPLLLLPLWIRAQRKERAAADADADAAPSE